MWYEAFSSKNSIKYLKYRIKAKNINLLKNQFNFFLRKNNSLTTHQYIIPKNWNVLIVHNLKLKSCYVFLYSKFYFVKILLPISKEFVHYDLNTRQLVTTVLSYNNYFSLYSMYALKFYNALIKPVFIKLKFKGKGYYIYKNYRNTITPQFGYSHRLYLYSFSVYVKFLNKTTLVCFGLNQNNVNSTSKKLFSWRPINIFTSRGVRFSKQIFYKKSGKISSYR